MKNLTKVFAIAIAMFGFATSSFAQTATTTGSVGAINEINLFEPVTGLTLDADGVAVTLATITVSNNYESAFELTLAFTNSGVFKRYEAGSDTKLEAGNGALIPMTDLTLVANGVGFGDGITAPALITLDEGAFTYDAVSQTTATVSQAMDIKCSWLADEDDLQGLYSETITATLTSTDGDYVE
ncbi:MAG: hypothetical protein ACERIH_11680 [Labilibaculum antarcticum]